MGNQHSEPSNTNSTRSYDPDSAMSTLDVITTKYKSRSRQSRASTIYTSDLIPPMDVSSMNLRKLASSNSNPSCDTISTGTRQRRRSSLLIVRNGVTGALISSRICKIAAKFWKNNIETLSTADQLEIGCSIFFAMMAANHQMRKIMKSNRLSSASIESTSVKYLDMMGWLIRHLVSDDIDLYSLLQKLGVVHSQMGITIHHFTPMLKAMHECFAYYFEERYNIEVKYAVDEIFAFAAQVMTGANLHCSSHLKNINKQFQGDHIPFLQSLNACLKSPIGTEYLYRYLSQTWCDEIVIFLQSLKRFKHLMTDKERFFVAREVTKHSIDPSATLTLNLSYENRKKCLSNMAELEKQFALKEALVVPTNFYDDIEKDVLKLIMDNHWSRFVEDIETLQLKSFELQPIQ